MAMFWAVMILLGVVGLGVLLVILLVKQLRGDPPLCTIISGIVGALQPGDY